MFHTMIKCNDSSILVQQGNAAVSTLNHPMSLELCRTFVAIVDEQGSLLAAAKSLGDTNANCSRRIRPILHGLPPHLPRPWLRKVGKLFTLTPEGSQMLPYAQEIVERWQNLVRLTGVTRPEGLKIACGQEAAGGLVLQAARPFREAFPDVPFSVAVVRGRQRIEGVANGLYDLALVTSTRTDAEMIAQRKLAFHELNDDELKLTCATRSPWAEAFREPKAVTIHELLRWPLIVPEADSAVRQQFDAKLRKQSPELPTIAMEVGGWRVLLGYVLANFGVGLLPSSVIAEAGSKLRSRPLDRTLRPTNQLRIATLPRPTNAEHVAAFLAELQAAMR